MRQWTIFNETMVKLVNETMNRQNVEPVVTLTAPLGRGHRFQSETYTGDFDDIAVGQGSGLG